MKYYIAGIALFAAFAALAFIVSSHNAQVTGWDRAAFLSVNSPQGGALDHAMVLLTEYGREAVWIGALVLVFVFGGRDGSRTAALLVIAFAILIPVGTALKDVIDRPRPVPASPDHLLAKHDSDPSFPSGHAVIVSAGAFVMLARFRRGRQAAFSVALLVEAFLVIYSRVYVGDHYPLDVVGGTLVGTGMASLVVGVSGRLEPVLARLDFRK